MLAYANHWIILHLVGVITNPFLVKKYYQMHDDMYFNGQYFMSNAVAYLNYIHSLFIKELTLVKKYVTLNF